jgi:glutathione peroxidase
MKSRSALFLLSLFGIAGTSTASTATLPPDNGGIYNFTMKNIDGKEVPLSTFAGKVLLIVNVASRCGYTPQYKELEALYTRFADSGLVILGFPANNFLSQEPGTDAEIKTFCTTTYGVTFPMFSKISVKGDDQHPLYRWLTSEESDPKFAGSVKWNFTKYLVDRNGNVIGKFGSSVKPLSDEVVNAVATALRQ